MTARPVLKVTSGAAIPTICYDPALRHLYHSIVTPCRRKLVLLADKNRGVTFQHHVRPHAETTVQLQEGLNVVSYCSKYLSYCESCRLDRTGAHFRILGPPEGAELSFRFKGTYRTIQQYNCSLSQEYPLTIGRRCQWLIIVKPIQGAPTLKQQGIVDFLESRNILGLPLPLQRNLKDFTDAEIPESIKRINWINVELRGQSQSTVFPVPLSLDIFLEDSGEFDDSDSDSSSAHD